MGWRGTGGREGGRVGERVGGMKGGGGRGEDASLPSAGGSSQSIHNKFSKVAFSSMGLIYGVCSVECSIAGHFFRHLPHCELFGGGDGSKADAAHTIPPRTLPQFFSPLHPPPYSSLLTFSYLSFFPLLLSRCACCFLIALVALSLLSLLSWHQLHRFSLPALQALSLFSSP